MLLAYLEKAQAVPFQEGEACLEPQAKEEKLNQLEVGLQDMEEYLVVGLRQEDYHLRHGPILPEKAIQADISLSLEALFCIEGNSRDH